MEEPVQVIAEVVKETDLAWLVDTGGDEVWLPKSQVELVEGDGQEGVDCLFEVPCWLALEKDLI